MANADKSINRSSNNSKKSNSAGSSGNTGSSGKRKGMAAYTSIVILSAAALLSILTVKFGISDLYTLIFMAILGIIAESLSVYLSENWVVSVGFAITLSAMLSMGPVGAAWVTAAAALFKVVYRRNAGYIHLFNTPVYKTLFNASNYILSCLISGYIYILAGGRFIQHDVESINEMVRYLGSVAVPIILMILAYLIVNSGILAILFSIITGKMTLRQWIYSFRWAIPNLFAVACIGLIICIAYNGYGPFAVVLFFGPLLLARYSFKLYMDMRNVYIDTIKALTAAIEAKDKYTEGHSRRVGKYTEMIAAEMHLSPARVETLKYAALLHDIGKIGVSENILNKPQKLTEYEFDIITLHPAMGCKILEEVDFLKKARVIMRHHHERYDGYGYPDHLIGEEIPMESLIMAVADTFDAMTTDRPYRKALLLETAFETIKKESGRQFAPEVVAAFEKVIGKYADELAHIRCEHEEVRAHVS